MKLKSKFLKRNPATRRKTSEGVGRPAIVIDNKILKRVEEMASLGIPNKVIAFNLGMAKGTLYEKLNSNPDFLSALNRGLAKGHEAVARALHVNIMTGTEREPGGSVKAQMFWLERKGGWIKTVELTGNESKPLKIIFQVSQSPRRTIDV